MEFSGSRIPWLRAAGAAGAVGAMVIGGAVTTAGAISDPGGAEPAKVQFMATDAKGDWFSCDVDVDLEGGPAGDGAALTITNLRGEADADGVSYGVVIGGTAEPGDPSRVVVGGHTMEPDAAGAPAVGPFPAGAEAVAIGEAPDLPAPSGVRQGTVEECRDIDVTVGPAPVAPPGDPAGVPSGAGGRDQEG